MQKGRWRGINILALFILACWLPALAGCLIQSQALENPARVPPSQEMTKVSPLDAYVLDVGDELTIRVWNFSELDRSSLRVNNSGEIYYPLAGAVKVAGLTVPKAHDLLVARLKKYIVDPQVEILITSASRQAIGVFGEVNSPSLVYYTRPLMLMEAIAKAGWYNNNANRKKVIVVRKANDKFNIYAIETAAFFRNGSTIQNFYLQGGDLVYVPPLGIVTLERLLNHVQTLAQPFLTVEQAVVLWPNFINALTGKTTTAPSVAVSTPTTSSTTTTGTSGSSTGQ